MVSRRRFPVTTPYLVAAVDANHDGRVAMARRLVSLAADAGAHAIKFDIGSADDGRRAFDLAAWRAIVNDAAGRIDVVLAPRDHASVTLARRLTPAAIQVEPAVLGDVELLAAIARIRRPVLLVAGACTTMAIERALRALRGSQVVVLHSISRAGLPAAEARLRYIPWLAHRFKRPAGYLGREHGIGWTFVAVALGAIVIERPFTLDPTLPGADHSASIGPDELRRVARGLADLSQALQPVGERRVFREELGALEASGRALVARRALRAGRVLRASDVSAGPSAAGLSVRLGRWVTGKRLRYDLEAGEPITFGILDSE